MTKNLFLLLLLFGQIVSLNAQNFSLNLEDSSWRVKAQDTGVFMPAFLPGNIHTDLLKNGIIPDPFLAKNESSVQWVGQKNWVYKSQFILGSNELKETHHELILEDIDTYADVYLNGQWIGSTENQFRKYVFPVHGFLKANNEILIVFKSVLDIATKEAKKFPFTYPGEDKVFVRKAQYQFGWDWGPTLLTCGIGKIRLNGWSHAKFLYTQYQLVSLQEKEAKLRFNLSIQSDTSMDAKVVYIYLHEGKAVVTQIVLPLKVGTHNYPIDVSIQNPILWWCNGYGKPHLYPFTILAYAGQEFIGSNQMDIGIRTIKWVQKSDLVGSSFYLELNGVPIYSKGANYIPPHSFLNGLNDSVYKTLVQNAQDANMNMLRVWGGGVYAPDAFYKACDELGLLVWQDFMFACAMYPAHQEMRENLKNEFDDQIIRVRNHPSLAIWCGNNESDEGWKNWGWQKQYNYSASDSAAIANDYQKIFDQLIPQRVGLLDSGRFYWPSSPSIGWGRKESLLRGDAHYWGVWWGMLPFEMYEQKVGRFMSEYGFQALPSKHTFAKIMQTDKSIIDSSILLAHQKHPTGYQTINTYMERDYPKPQNFEDYIYLSQLLQARGMKIAIEAHRRTKPYNMGTLYWQLNDCWPVTSWSSTDYYGHKKAAYYQIKRSFEPTLISFETDSINNTITAKLIHDGHDSLWGTRSYRLINIKKNRVNKIRVKENKPLIFNSAHAHTLYVFNNFRRKHLKNHPENYALEVAFTTHKKRYRAIYYFVKPKNMKLPKPKISFDLVADTCLIIHAKNLAKDIFISSKQTELNLSDNFFDLLPGETKIVYLLQKNTLLKKEDILIQTLYNTQK